MCSYINIAEFKASYPCSQSILIIIFNPDVIPLFITPFVKKKMSLNDQNAFNANASIICN